MKQIKGIFLFLMSVVLVAFGSQDSKNAKNLLKKLKDETKEVGKNIVGKKNKAVIADNKKEEAKKEENKKVEQKPAKPQPVQQPAPAAAVQPPQQQPQQPQQNAANNPNSAQNKAVSPEYALNANNKTGGRKGSKKYKKGNQYNFYKEPKHSRLKHSSSSHKSSQVKSQDSSVKPSAGGNSGGSSSSGGTSTGGGDSTSSE